MVGVVGDEGSCIEKLIITRVRQFAIICIVGCRYRHCILSFCETRFTWLISSYGLKSLSR